jgi:hypothetical protein
MTISYSTNLKLNVITTGTEAGTWGDYTNTNIGTLLEQAISGYTTQAITDGAATTITMPDGVSGVARNMYLELTGALTADRELQVPAAKKLYFIYNNTTGGFAVTVKVSGQTGVSVPNGKKMLLVNNGTDVIGAVSAFDTGVRVQNSSASPALEVAGDNNGVVNPLLAVNRIRFTDLDTTATSGEYTGSLEWYTSDPTTSARVTAYIASTKLGTSGGGSLHFGVSTNTGNATEYMVLNGANGHLSLVNNLGVGTTGADANVVRVGTGGLSGDNQRGVNVVSTFTSASTTSAYSFVSAPNLATGAAYTLAVGLRVNDVTLEGTATLTTQVGFDCGALSSGTNVYGFRGTVASAANKYNLYMSGTAQNYLAGSLGIGTGATAPESALDVWSSGNAAQLRTAAGGDADGVLLNFHQQDTTITLGQGYGGVTWEGDDAGGSGVRGYIKGFADGTGGEMCLRFGVAATGSVTERMRLKNDGTFFGCQRAPSTYNSTGTKTGSTLVAAMQDAIITSSTASTVTMQLPTGTEMDAQDDSLPANNSLDWSVINTGATNALTVTSNTDHTVVGNMVVAASTSGLFRTRKTSANTFITYRIA